MSIRNAFIISLSLLFSSQSVMSQGVSIGSYNMISADSRILKIVFPPDTPIEGNPIFSDDSKTAMVRFSDKAEGQVVNGVLETVSGKYILSLKPNSIIPPQVIRIGGAGVSLEIGDASNPNILFIPVVSSVAQGIQPRGYQETKVNEVLNYGAFKAYPQKSYSNNRFEVIRYKLISKERSVQVEASQFYAAGVKAVHIDSSTISPEHESTLIVVRVAQ
ncbi:MAG: hypothetical protein IBX55_11605 [Methyloprofundus sp.]|nr:hypothetical protein [Methyloprofundus sp.]